LKNKFVWIENIKSFSGRHRLRGDSAVGSSLWYPDFFEETQKIYLAKPGERVYHFLNMENMLGFSTISSEYKRQKYKTKAQKRVAYLESMARGIKVCAKNDLSQIFTLQLSDHKRLNEFFSLDKALTSKGSLREFMAPEYKEEFEYLVEELSKGSSLIRLSFSFWLFVVSFRSSTI
jgi:hypothetical protein